MGEMRVVLFPRLKEKQEECKMHQFGKATDKGMSCKGQKRGGGKNMQKLEPEVSHCNPAVSLQL